jgi:hypothetical protein
MARLVAGIGAAIVATVLILGPARPLLSGSPRAQLPDAPGTSASAHGDRASGPATAAIPVSSPGPNAARVTLDARLSTKPTQGYILSARLQSADGKPLNEVPVRYYEIVDLFGQREMFLGETTTDGQGDGSFIYLPAQLGPHEIVARTPGRAPATRNETRITLDAQVAAASYRTEAPPLAAFSAILPYVVGALVFSVWALLAFALFATARGVLGGARDHAQRKGDPA